MESNEKNLECLKIPEVVSWLTLYRGRNIKTYKRRESDIVNFCTACDITTTERLVNADAFDFEKVLKYAQSKGWKNTVTNLLIASLKCFYRFLDEQYGYNNKLMKNLHALPKDAEPQYSMTQDEIFALINQMKKIRSNSRNYALFSLYLMSGARFSEIANLELSDINPDGTLHIRGKGSKVRNQPVPQWVMDVVKSYIATDRKKVADKFYELTGIETNYVFLSKIQTQNVENQKKTKLRLSNTHLNETVRHYAKKAGIQNYKRIHIHGLRHSYATMMYEESGGDLAVVQKLLGHSNITTTQLYVDVTREHINSLVEKLNSKVAMK